MLWEIKTVEMSMRIQNVQGDRKRRTEILSRFRFALIKAVTFEQGFEGGEGDSYIDVRGKNIPGSEIN